MKEIGDIVDALKLLLMEIADYDVIEVESLAEEDWI